MKLVQTELIENLNNEARNSNRLRKNYNLHETLDDTLQRLLNALEPYSYVQPHRHLNPDKREIFVIIKGRLLVVIFNDEGDIIEHCILDRDGGTYIAEVAVGEWHTIVALEPGTVVFEVKDGPYQPINDKSFASWAPKENDPGAISYLKELLDKLCVSVEVV